MPVVLRHISGILGLWVRQLYERNRESGEGEGVEQSVVSWAVFAGKPRQVPQGQLVGRVETLQHALQLWLC